MNPRQERQGLLFILVGPTGAGKNTLMNRVLDDMEDLAQLPTATSRGIRPTEEEGREHHFVTEQRFRQMIADNDLLEWQEVHGRLYGVPRGTVEYLIVNRLDRVADVDVLGAMTVRAVYPDNVVLVFVQPGKLDNIEATVRERLALRGENEAEIENRLLRIPMEMSYAPYCDYLVVNEDMEQAVRTLNGIILAERSRRDLANLKVRQDFPRHPLVHKVTLVATYDDRALCIDGTLPADLIMDGELPQEAALRALETVEDRAPSVLGATPLHVDLQPNKYHEELIFWFQVPATYTDDLPEGWSWAPLDSLRIPEAVREALPTAPLENPVDV